VFFTVLCGTSLFASALLLLAMRKLERAVAQPKPVSSSVDEFPADSEGITVRPTAVKR